MKITLNGKEFEIGENITVAVLLENNNIDLNKTVVEYNGEIIPKEQFREKVIEPESVIEVLRFVGGG